MIDRDTQRFYKENALDYSRSTSARSMDHALIPFSKFVKPGGAVIDLGCGSGRDLTSLLRLGFRPIGLDVSKELAEIAAGVSHCPVVIGDLSSLPFAAASFDAAWASASLLHLGARELSPALLEVARIVRPLGVFFSSVKAGRGSFRDVDGRLFTYYEEDEWRGRIEEAGFAVLDLKVGAQITEPSDNSTWISCLAKRNSDAYGRGE
ncbi:methyltransferase domain-containing protein [Pleomorphomonas sp. PLEO]|uniref:methyltransferase domain-containing protein n=1 Tax=Pleomorphomonas sp. PLEO TaxID=3239306 RepID=UPI00351F2DCE